MGLNIILESNRVTLNLLEKNQAIDSETALYYHDLSELLISVLDKLLNRHKLSRRMLKSFKINNNLGNNSTSYKIAQSFIQALKIDY